MNDTLYQVIQKHHLHPKGYTKLGKALLIKEDKHYYILKLQTNNIDIYKYLLSRDFKNFPHYYNSLEDNYDLLEYIDNTKVNDLQKVDDYLTLLSLLHAKTLYTRRINLDEIKKIYEDLQKKINNTLIFYEKLNDNIDEEQFLSPSMYLLVRNISIIYKLLSFARQTLDKWYIMIKKDLQIKVSLLHNNVDLNHLLNSDKNYFISWDKALFDSPIYELESFYRKYYTLMDLSGFLAKYQVINKLSDNDINLMLARLSIPKMVIISHHNYLDTLNMNQELDYLKRIYDYVLTLN